MSWVVWKSSRRWDRWATVSDWNRRQESLAGSGDVLLGCAHHFMTRTPIYGSYVTHLRRFRIPHQHAHGLPYHQWISARDACRRFSSLAGDIHVTRLPQGRDPSR